MSQQLLDGKTIGLMVFSYKAPLTLAATMGSYRASGFLELFDDVCIFFIGSTKDDHAVAEEYGARYVDCDEELGFIGAIKELEKEARTDYLIWAEHDCRIWSRLKQEDLYRQLKESLGVLERDAADLVRLRHSWLGNPTVSAASLYSYYYEIRQLSSHWRNSEALSEAPSWVKWLRRKLNPRRAQRWIGRAVYVEEEPHLIYPKYIHKDGNLFIVDSEVFPWSNQPSLFSRDFMLNGAKRLEELNLNPGGRKISRSYFAKTINTEVWRKAHHRIGVAPGIFTWTSVSGHSS